MLNVLNVVSFIINTYVFFVDMASSSRQSLRPSNQIFQHQNRQLNPLQPANNKSVPAILSRKRKLENIEMVSTGYKMIFQIFWLSSYAGSLLIFCNDHHFMKMFFYNIQSAFLLFGKPGSSESKSYFCTLNLPL